MTEVDPIEAQREATATIRGYVYQFDASILAVLGAGAGAKVTVEGVEDFDILSSDTDVYGQVKYYEAQKLTDSTLRDAILPMIRGLLRVPTEVRKRRHYMLYGHFKQAPAAAPVFALADLKRILVERPYKTDAKTGARARVEVNLQTELGASDQDLADFCGCFSVELSQSYDAHREAVVAALRDALDVSLAEAKAFLYPSALTAMAALSTGRSKPERTTTRAAFLQQIRPNIALYSAWALREESESFYCKQIRDLHFARLNIDSRDRFFVITLPDADGMDELHVLVQHIIGRWSSHRINAKPAKERYAPFFYCPALDADALAELKRRVVGDGHKITDGFAFQGADFSTEHLMLPQTRDYRVSARFVADGVQFAAALAAARTQRLIVQLHAGDAHPVDPAVQQIAIPIRSAGMARKIV